jgi:capsular polysaccharide biosynthesis protein
VNHAEGNHNGNSRAQAEIGALSTDDVRERLWAYEDFVAAQEQQPFNVAGAFASLGYLFTAIRRSRRLWLTWAAIGLVAGLAIYVKYPVSYQATVSVLIKNNPGEDPVSAMLTQEQLVQSESVAASTVKSLGLTQSVSSFQAAYTAKAVTNPVSPTPRPPPAPGGAPPAADTLARQYLTFRANLLLAQQAQDAAAYAQQVPAAQQHIASLQTQIDQLQGQPGQQAKLKNLQSQLQTATNTLPTLEQTVSGLTANERSTTSSMIDGSQVLDAAALTHHSKIKNIIEYLLSGLIGGLAIGLGIVIVRELVSDRLRRRDDIAAALGAPVRLSVGAVRKRPLALRRRAGADRNRALRRLAVYWRNAALRQGKEPATLAIVAVDNAREIAPAVAIFAERWAKEDVKLVVADLTKGAPVAKLLGARGTGVQSVRLGAGSIVVVTPEEADQVPSGPLRPATVGGAGLLAEPPTEALGSVARDAKVMLTVAELDPAVGGEYLSTWATEAVAVFTAGRTRAARAYAVGELLRLSGMRAISGIVIGADKADESLGTIPDDAITLAELAVPSGNGDGTTLNGGGKPGASLQ